MGNLNEFFRDLGRNAYGLGENVASLGSAAIAEPVAGFAAMYDPANGAQAIREGMTYQPRTQAGQMYQQGAARTLGTLAKPVMPVIDTWQRGVDIAGGYSPAAGAMLRTVPTALGVLMGAKPALQAGRQVSNTLGSLQGRMVANANMPNTLNRGFMGQRGAIGTQRPLTEFEQAHAIAQRNAALPVNQGGLGLAPDNAAMDRARAMGFDVDNPVYHGTDKTFDAFDLGRFGSQTSMPPNFPKGIYTAPSTEIASRYGKGEGSNIIPLLMNKKNPISTTDTISSADAFRRFNIGDADTFVSSNVAVARSPSQLRSRFAAFDPFNRDSSNLLAQSAKFAPAATLGAYTANEKRKEKRN